MRTKLHIWHIFKESTERRKNSFLKETEENTDLHRGVLKHRPHKNFAVPLMW